MKRQTVRQMDRALEKVLEAQFELHGKIARTAENLQKTSASRMTLGMAEARLQALENNWRKFEDNHELLRDAPKEVLKGHTYLNEKLCDRVEEAYLTNKGLLLDCLRHLRQQEAAASSSLTSSEVKSSAPRTTLPRIQLPQFSGRYEDWPAFRDLFTSILGRDPGTTSVEKLHYLKTCVKGEAELLIQNFPTTGENFGRAWAALSGYYENKRLLVRAYLANFLALPKMRNESASELRKIFHGVRAAVSSLNGIGRPIKSSEDLFVYLIVELLDPRSRREWETSISDTTEPPAYAILEKFLDRRLHTLESMQPLKTETTTAKPGQGSQKVTRSHLARKQESKPDSKRGRCSLCQKDHFLMLCDDYKRKSATERKQHIDENHLCLNCLGRHKVSECSSKKDCTACGSRHHTSIHDACRESEGTKTSHIAHESAEKSVAVLLATALVRVADRHGTWHFARALVDQGSESSIIGESLVQRLKLKRSPASVSVFGVGGQKTAVCKGRVSLAITPRAGGPILHATALVLPRLTVYAGGLDIEDRSWPHLHGLHLADPGYKTAGPIEILLGADVFSIILQSGLRKGGARAPVAQNTSLGWILSGVIGDAASAQAAHTYQCRVEEDLSAVVRLFWEQEEVPAAAPALSSEEMECEDHFVRTHSRNSDGRYSVRLPVIAPLPDFSATRNTAARALRQMERRFTRDPTLHLLYSDFLRQYADLKHMSRVAPAPDATRPRHCYLPHHGVMREASASTKLRVVFNGSSKVPSGDTLNNHLMTGPNLLPALVDILLRWRRHRYVLAADIEKMYRQIEVHPEDRTLQRILWREHPGEEVSEYELNTITYGLACAPFLAIRTLRQLAEDDGKEWPLGAAALRDDTYMDDILTGSSTIQEAVAIQRQLIQICRAGGLPLKKWSANDAALLEELTPEDKLLREPRWWRPGESHSTLGLRWHPEEDSFSFSAKLGGLETFTKRAVLSLAARLFDPLGWLSPATIRAKILFQATWLLKLDWDEPLPPPMSDSGRTSRRTWMPWKGFASRDGWLEMLGAAAATCTASLMRRRELTLPSSTYVPGTKGVK